MDSGQARVSAGGVWRENRDGRGLQARVSGGGARGGADDRETGGNVGGGGGRGGGC